MSKYTEATHESIKKVLENAERNNMIAVGLNVSLVREMIDEIERLQMVIGDYRQDIATVLDEKCATDEKHCGCVPILRKEIERLNKRYVPIWEKLNTEPLSTPLRPNPEAEPE